jgi:hypothetical protein
VSDVEKSQGQRSGGGTGRKVAAGVEDTDPKKQMPLPVWFFVGIIFVVYGVMILVTGLIEFSHPAHTELWQLHPAIWWGAVILAVGVFFSTRHRKRRE